MQSYAIIFDLQGVLCIDPDVILRAPMHTEPERHPYWLIAGLAIARQCVDARTPNGSARHRVFLMSNCRFTAQQIKSAHPELFDHFQAIITCATYPYYKPDPAAFRYVISKYELEPANCIFIDDSQLNCAIAHSLGMHAIVYDDPEKVRAQLKALNVF